MPMRPIIGGGFAIEGTVELGDETWDAALVTNSEGGVELKLEMPSGTPQYAVAAWEADGHAPVLHVLLRKGIEYDCDSDTGFYQRARRFVQLRVTTHAPSGNPLTDALTNKRRRT